MRLAMQWKRKKCLQNHGDGIKQHHHHTTIEEKRNDTCRWEKKHKRNLHTNNKSHKIQMEKTKKTNYKIIKNQT